MCSSRYLAHIVNLLLVSEKQSKHSTTIERENKDLVGYLDSLIRYKYVLCPEGNGIDTHRFWETIYAGSIPVSKKHITGAEFFDHAVKMAKKYGWEFGGEIAGHLIGHFPHEKLANEDKTNYVHPNNDVDMYALDKNGNKRDWILEIHFINKEKEIGGFFEQLLTC